MLKLNQLTGFGVGFGNIIGRLFQTALYVGNGTSQSIDNGLDLSGDGGVVWIKNRDAADFNVLSNTETGITDYLRSDSNINETAGAGAFVSSADTTGFSIGAANEVNTNTENYVSWTWKEAENFFDIVSYTGNSASRTIAHSLAATPTMMVIKKVSGGGFEQPWAVFFSDLGANMYMSFNTDLAPITNTLVFDNTAPTSTVFSVGNDVLSNDSGDAYVCILFSGDNSGIMQIAEYTGNGSGSGPSVSLGWKPQFVLIKGQVAGSDWNIFDNKRGESNRLSPNLIAAEDTPSYITFTGSGFDIISANIDVNQNTEIYSYLAIRQQ